MTRGGQLAGHSLDARLTNALSPPRVPTASRLRRRHAREPPPRVQDMHVRRMDHDAQPPHHLARRHAAVLRRRPRAHAPPLPLPHQRPALAHKRAQRGRHLPVRARDEPAWLREGAPRCAAIAAPAYPRGMAAPGSRCPAATAAKTINIRGGESARANTATEWSGEATTHECGPHTGREGRAKRGEV